MGFEPITTVPVGAQVLYHSPILLQPRQPRGAWINGPGAKPGTVDLTVLGNYRLDKQQKGLPALMFVADVPIFEAYPDTMSRAFCVPVQVEEAAAKSAGPKVEGDDAAGGEVLEDPAETSEEEIDHDANRPLPLATPEPEQTSKRVEAPIQQLAAFPSFKRAAEAIIQAGGRIEVQQFAIVAKSRKDQTVAVIRWDYAKGRPESERGYSVDAYAKGPEKLSTVCSGLVEKDGGPNKGRWVSRGIEAFKAIALATVAVPNSRQAAKLTKAALEAA